MSALVTRWFRAYGWVCAQKPWEVMFLVITATVAIITMPGDSTTTPPPGGDEGSVYQGGMDSVVMTALRCGATLYTYHQMRLLHRQGSPHILGECLFGSPSSSGGTYTNSIIF